MRVVKDSNDFFDILDSLKGGAIVTIGYVTAADLNVPVVKRKNPATNRMKGYNDYTVFQDKGENEIGALVKLTSYNFNYRNRQSVHDEYHNRVKPETNRIRQEFGIGDTESRSGYKTVLNFGNSGQETYGGRNEKLFGHSYSPQNLYKPLNIKSSIYAVGQDGHIMRELNKENIAPYLKSKTVSGVSALRKLGADEERIKEYIEQINGLKFKYRNFEANSILYIVATVNGEKMIYINNNLQRCVDDININPEDFIKIAQERYKKDMVQENRKMFKLTENDLKYIITESVKRIVKEGFRDSLGRNWERGGRIPRDGMTGGSWGSSTVRGKYMVPLDTVCERLSEQSYLAGIYETLEQMEDKFYFNVTAQYGYDDTVGLDEGFDNVQVDIEPAIEALQTCVALSNEQKSEIFEILKNLADEIEEGEGGNEFEKVEFYD